MPGVCLVLTQKDHEGPMTKDIEELQTALRESVKLQSHYAGLLNIHDGGERRQFNDADAWIKRLRETGTLKKTEPPPTQEERFKGKNKHPWERRCP